MISESKLRVRYNETDAMGLVYYANYLIWFEIGRTDWFRRSGKTYREIEEEGLVLPVVEANCKYLAPARYDDPIIVKTEWQDTEDLFFLFVYRICRETDGRLLAEGWTKHLCADKNGRIRRDATRRLKEACRNLNE